MNIADALLSKNYANGELIIKQVNTYLYIFWIKSRILSKEDKFNYRLY